MLPNIGWDEKKVCGWKVCMIKGFFWQILWLEQGFIGKKVILVLIISANENEQGIFLLNTANHMVSTATGIWFNVWNGLND